MSLTVKQITDIGCKQLESLGIADAKRDSNLLYCYMMGVPESQMLTEYQYALQDMLCDKYFALVDRRAAGEPLQYIVGTTEFMGLPIKVSPSVLIPRQDTETLVEDALEIINQGSLRGEPAVAAKRAWDVLDLGTGSGAIAISIAKLGNKCNITASDISKEALEVAKENAKLNGVDKNIKFLCGNSFKPFEGRFGAKKFDMIISNPPYIPTEVIGQLQREIREHEPLLALEGGEDGLDYYRIIARNVGNHLKEEGVLMLEIGHDQGTDVANLLRDTGLFSNISCNKDLAGHDRVIFAKRI